MSSNGYYIEFSIGSILQLLTVVIKLLHRGALLLRRKSKGNLSTQVR